MEYRRSLSFKKLFNSLKPEIQELAKKQYQLLKLDSTHHSLSFKHLAGTFNYSVKINDNYRALGTLINNFSPSVIVWFFIGTHDDYQKSKTKIYKPIKNKK